MRTWKAVFCSGSQHEAEVVRAMLEAHEINVVLVDQHSTPYPQMGETELRVAPDDVVRALYLVRKQNEE